MLSCSAVSDSLQPHDCSLLHCRWLLYQLSYQGSPECWSGQPVPSPGDLPNPGIEPGSPALQAASLPTELPGKPKSTEVGSLSLLQGIFPTQESNPGLLHYRWLLYRLSYQGHPTQRIT